MSSKGDSKGAYNGPCATLTIIAAQYSIPLGGAAAYGAATQGTAKSNLGSMLMAYAGAMANAYQGAYQGSTATTQQAQLPGYTPTSTSTSNTFTIGNPQTQTYTATNSMAATNSIADVVAKQATEQAYEPASIDVKAEKLSKQIGEARKEAKAEQPLVMETTASKFDKAKADKFTYQQEKSEDAYGIKTAEQKDAYGVTPAKKKTREYRGTPEVQAAQKELAEPNETAKEVAYEKTEPKHLEAPTTNTQLPKRLTTINRNMPANYQDTYNISPQVLYNAAKNPHYDTLPGYNSRALINGRTINHAMLGMSSPNISSEMMAQVQEEDRRRKLRAMIAHAN